MTSEEIIKAVDYKKGHFNMVQYILREKPEWSISVYDIEEDRFSVEKSKDYQQIKKAKDKLPIIIIGIFVVRPPLAIKILFCIQNCTLLGRRVNCRY